MSEEKLYTERCAMALDNAGGYYARHVQAMTAEELHDKGDIAAELGHRDLQIDRLKQKLSAISELVWADDEADAYDLVASVREMC